MSSPYSSTHSQTRSTNASRPISSRRAALLLELALDHPLRGDPGVVLAEDPLRALPAHARHPDLDVLDRRVQRVAHVEVAGHVRRRHRDREVLVRRALGLGMEDPGLVPAREHARLDVGGLVASALLERLQAVLGHRAEVSHADCWRLRAARGGMGNRRLG